ncbi:MAG: cysteine--tRNA ligase [Elusimicrobia bacterium]|nr:cysteine--tRNA ligase [Elusimicrobiota bacterium]
MELALFNTLTRSKDPFKPIAPPKVGLYTCGPTVYNYLHVGNYRTYVFEDVLRRTLEFLGFDVLHVMNITDVGHLTSQADEGEDKMEVGAAREGKTAWEIADFYTKTFVEDSKLLNLIPPKVLCKATDHVPEQIDLVKRLEAKGFTYSTSDGVYFDTSKFPAYGKLVSSEHTFISFVGGLKAGARVEVNPEKRNPTDFALWKFSPKGTKRQMEWPSPWGVGFPGWHIECSAMAMKYLGETFDIHCGGVDHIPIHHTNEIAQTEGATGKPFAKWWMHGEFLLMNNAKMAKSAGGFIRLQDLQEKGYDPLDYRYLCFQAHYRKQLDFSLAALDAAKSGLKSLRDRAQLIARESKPARTKDVEALLDRFKEAISDDLNMPQALSVVSEAVKKLPAEGQHAFLLEADKVLGLRLIPEGAQELAPEVVKLLNERLSARKNKDFAAADALRKMLADKGILIEDTKDGQRWKRK